MWEMDDRRAGNIILSKKAFAKLFLLVFWSCKHYPLTKTFHKQYMTQG